MNDDSEKPIGDSKTITESELTTDSNVFVIDVNDKNYWYERIHPDFQSMPRLPVFNIDSWFKVKLFTLVAMMAPSPRTPPDLKSEKISGIGVYHYPTNGAYKERPPAALLWIHSGGRIIGAADNTDDIKFCHNLCRELDMPVLSASYRLAPKHPFPAALDDITIAYKWLVERLQTENLCEEKQQSVRIAVAGDSAGGGLSAELCQKLADEQSSDNGLPVPVAQLLIYPMLDDRTCVNEHFDNWPPHLIWNNKSNMYGWSSYLGPNHKPGQETLPDYASASRRKDLTNLPSAFIACGTLDLFLTECRDYVQRLQDHGVNVMYHEIEGGFHGMLNFHDKDSVIELWAHLVSFGKKYLKPV